MTDEGKLVIVHRQRQPFRRMEVFDLDRQPIELPPGEETKRSADLSAEPTRQDHWLLLRRPGPRQRVMLAETDQQLEEAWYLVYDGNRSRRFYLQGKDIDSGRTIGYIGRDGFQETKPDTASQFQDPPWRLTREWDPFRSARNVTGAILLDGRRLLSVNFQRRSVEPIIEGEIISMDRMDYRISAPGDTLSSRSAVWSVRTDDRVWNADLQGVQQTYLIPEELRGRTFEFFALENEAIYATPKDGDEPRWEPDGVERTRELEVVRATASGDITERTTVALSSLWHRDRNTGLSNEAEVRIMVAGVPAAIWSAGVSFGFLPLLSMQMDEEPTFSQALAHWASQLWWVVLPVLLFCGWLARRTLEHQRRHHLPDDWFWAVFVFLFGLPGYLAYRLHRPWPRIEPVPAPEPTGLEVFAPGLAKPTTV